MHKFLKLHSLKFSKDGLVAAAVWETKPDVFTVAIQYIGFGKAKSFAKFPTLAEATASQNRFLSNEDRMAFDPH